MEKQKYYITTAIAYTSGKPHIGNTYEAVLADAIAKQIMELNGSDQPQAVIMVGGGSLTPHLADYVGEILGLAPGRVAVRHPEKIDGINEIP